jgi:hypothetical protein
MAGNLTSGNNQAYEDIGIRLFRGAHPDVAMIQEFNYKTNSDADIRSFIDQAFGPEFSYYREPGGKQIPNGIVSRFPILAAGAWVDTAVSNRSLVWARIDVPGATDLYAISVHLLTSSAANRNIEAQELVSHIQMLPADAYIVLAGDFNTANRTEECITSLDTVLEPGGPPPVDQLGNDKTNSSRAKPDDWVIPNAALLAKEVPVVIGANSFAHGFVADTRVYTPITDLAPALATDSGAVNMQHMGVIRAFDLSGGGTVTSSLTVTAPNGGETWPAGESHAITWTATNVDAVKVELTLDGTTWTTLSASTSAAAGSLPWVVPATASTAARVRVSAVPGGSPSDASDAPFNITVAQQTPGKVFINEILANEVGSDVSTEFVELVNSGDAAVDVSGWKLSDAVQVRHVFPAGTKVAGHAALVVTGATASTGLLSLTNSGDTVTLTDAQGTTVDRVAYASALAAKDGVSMNRKPDGDPAGSFVLHDTLSSKPSSPGTRADGSSWSGGSPPPPPTSITAEREPNDTAASANGPVGAPAVSGAIGTSSDADWYKFTVGATGTVKISVAISGSADLDWYLYKDTDTTNYVARGYTTANPEAGSFNATAGTYLLKVNGYQGAMASYSLQVTAP